MTAAHSSLGAAIRVKRTRAQLSARALSVAAGLSESYVGKIESGEMIAPSFRAVSKICAHLGMTSYEIYALVLDETVTPPREDV